MKERILSGIRATGHLHFGNFIGAVRHFVHYQEASEDCMFFIADLHTLTTLEEPDELRGNLLEIVKDYLAAGLDPARSTLYAQSSVPSISQLSLLLSMWQPLGELQRIPTYKELVRKHPDRVTHGLISYPVLMAADILGAQATLVPVGEDQVPNVELARNLAQRINARFGEVFTVPSMMDEMVKVPGLDGEKMGKSEADNAIDIDASGEEIRRRYRERGITDPQRLRPTDPGDPYNRCRSVYPLHRIISEGEAQSHAIAQQCQAGEIGCVACKDLLVASIMKVLKPFQERRRELAEQDDYAREVLHEGGKRARAIFDESCAALADKMGVIVY